MLKFKRKLLTGILAASIALSAGSGLVWSESEEAITEDTATSEETSEQPEDTEAADGEAAEGEDTDGEAAEEEEKAVTEEEALANMKLYAENDNLALYVNEETYVFAVQNKKNNY